MDLPHKFPSLINGATLPFLFIGSGFSRKSSGFFLSTEEILSKCPLVEKHFETTVQNVNLDDVNNNYRLFEWAEEMIKILIEKGIPCPRLKLADKLGIIDSNEYDGEYITPLLNNSPKHRVIARFAVENRLKSIWTTNWDTWIETAFEQVGLVRNEEQNKNRLWPVGFATFVTNKDIKDISINNIVKLFKPHGCIRIFKEALIELKNKNFPKAEKLSNRFMITKSDFKKWMQNANPTDQNISRHILLDFAQSPIIISGWSLSEPYFLDLIEENKESLNLNAINISFIDALSIIDPEFNNEHKKLAKYYGLSKAKTHIPVENKIDELFLWIQARYALNKILESNPPDLNTKTDISNILCSNLDNFNENHFSIKWVDNFLSAWCLFCWRGGYISNLTIDPSVLPNEPNAHIPWNLVEFDRPDLHSAAIFIQTIEKSNTDYNFEKYPGLFYSNSEIIIPVPAWDNNIGQNYLTALKSFLKPIGNSSGLISKIKLLPVNLNESQISSKLIEKYKTKISSILNCDVDKIISIEISNL